jgi:hypothetical protein
VSGEILRASEVSQAHKKPRRPEMRAQTCVEAPSLILPSWGGIAFNSSAAPDSLTFSDS